MPSSQGFRLNASLPPLNTRPTLKVVISVIGIIAAIAQQAHHSAQEN